jgi:hypothetical protein
VRLRRPRRPKKGLVTAGFVGGVLAGLVIWSMQMSRSRRDLFSRNAVKRLAALGYLGGQPSLETAQLLTEYLRWENKPVLRKRAERLLRRMQSALI